MPDILQVTPDLISARPELSILPMQIVMALNAAKEAGHYVLVPEVGDFENAINGDGSMLFIDPIGDEHGWHIALKAESIYEDKEYVFVEVGSFISNRTPEEFEELKEYEIEILTTEDGVDKLLKSRRKANKNKASKLIKECTKKAIEKFGASGKKVIVMATSRSFLSKVPFIVAGYADTNWLTLGSGVKNNIYMHTCTSRCPGGVCDAELRCSIRGVANEDGLSPCSLLVYQDSVDALQKFSETR